MIPATSNILFKSFDICYSQNKETTKYLKSLGSKKIKFIGNLKFSESKTQKNNNFDSNLKKIFKSKKIWCAASTHDNEEKICILAHKKLKIPLKNNARSLNISMAVAITLSEALKQNSFLK